MGENSSGGSSPLRVTLLSSAAKLLRAYNEPVRTLGITLMGLAMAGGAWAQEAAAPAGTFYRPQAWGSPNSFRLNLGLGALPPATVQPPRAVTRCTIPLLQMQVLQMRAPEAVDPSIQFVPRTDKVDPMPRAQLPPACDAAASR